MNVLGVIANPSKTRAAEVVRLLLDGASEHGLELIGDGPTSALVTGLTGMPCSDLFERVDALMALGGDGTMLRVVRELDGRDKPVIGVNVGGLGFLTSVAEGELARALKCLAEDNFVFGVRRIASCRILRDGETVDEYRALNDVVLGTGSRLRVICLRVSIDGQEVTSYTCDGLIVSTPTGSTGHSLSAGGPIVVPETRALVVSLVCPHTLSSRPLVVPEESEIDITPDTEERITLSVDGQVGRPVARGDCVRVRCSDRGVRFIHLPGHSYFSVLRQKLHWSGSNV